MRRTGEYQLQPKGYRAFIPAPPNPDPPVEIDIELQSLLSKADRALGRLDGSIQTLPNPELFVFMYVRKEAVLSSQIEGTQASIGDVLEIEAKIFNPARPNDVGEVLNYVAAMNHGLGRLANLPLSLRLIREIHERLMVGVRGELARPGEFRQSQNWIGPQGATLSEATFVPPPHTELPRLLGEFESFLHRQDSAPTLLQIGIAHAYFETLHPFLDGNGRVGRLLITFMLCEREILMRPVLYLSHYLKKHRQEYYDLLQANRDRGTLEDWLKFFLRGIAEVSNEATETARQIVAMREHYRTLINSEFGQGVGNATTVLEKIFDKPIITVNDVRNWTGLSFAASNNLVERFCEHDILTEITGKRRYRKFRYDPYIAIFSGD
jgi:cell filamentation protein, protein adenylyltransferase